MNKKNESFWSGIVLDILSESEIRVTPGVLAKEISKEAGVSLLEARAVIRRLTDQGEISYNYTFGSTYIEFSFARPVRVTDHFVLKPSGTIVTENNKRDIEIIIEPGISFGSGRHPTTRLSLMAIDNAFFKQKLFTPDKHLKAADIGTGSGVLAIAALKAGATECLAIDTDLNAIAEAEKNITLNKLDHRIRVTGVSIEKRQEKFDLICANLRFPTLKGLLPLFIDITDKDSVLILSGIRAWETKELVNLCSDRGFTCLWQKDDKQWSGLILQKFLTAV
ncbi:MAG: 50S ribosomal protein L11 methyltransferase [Thermodesulfobacteriota bacterium]|nr:50S ribosomal protein L11 methyltransferase [Thermodesulfobacteriota bacterium]